MILTVEQSGRSSQILEGKSAQRSVTVSEKLSGEAEARATVFFAVLKIKSGNIDDGEYLFTPDASGKGMLLGAMILDEYLPHFSWNPFHIMPFLPPITSTLKNGSPPGFLQITAGVR